MKMGKVSESVLKRSILKEIKTKRDEIIIGAGIGEDCAILALEEGEIFITSTDTTTMSDKEMGEHAVHHSVNNLATAGAEPVGISVSMLLPERAREASIKRMMEQMQEVCTKLKIQIIGGHTEITDAVVRPVLTITGIGKAKKESCLSTKEIKVGQDIVMSKWLGLEGTSLLAKEREEELLTKYPKHLVEEAKTFDRFLSIVPEAATAIKSGVSAMHDASEGGIFGALWEMAEGAGVGLEVDLKKLPIKQETVEVSEFFGINPYVLLSGGSLLMITDNGHDLVKELEKQDIKATVVGKITEGNDRIVINDEERRFLELPKSDEIRRLG